MKIRKRNKVKEKDDGKKNIKQRPREKKEGKTVKWKR
jgi:hypothetical protein